LGYICPIKFTIDYESAPMEHMSLCVLPIVDPWNIVDAVVGIKKPNNVTLTWLGRDEEKEIIFECQHFDSIKYTKKTFGSENKSFKPKIFNRK
jgi:hypothetical protein